MRRTRIACPLDRSGDLAREYVDLTGAAWGLFYIFQEHTNGLVRFHA